jgi:ATP-dependent Clp protease ATP-binding subunit ClpB
VQPGISDAALDLFGEAGFGSFCGVLPLRGAIRAQMENPLAQQILAGKFAPGDTIKVDARDGQLEWQSVR